MKAVTVQELNNYIKRKFDTDVNLTMVCVRGEISNFKHHYTGHMYMSLKDDSSSIRAVMFRSSVQRLKFEPENGMSVLVTGRVSVFERDGQYQIYIDDMIPDGIGRLYAAFEQLKAALEAKGYFAPEHKKPIPRYPSVVGVVTSPNGAAVRDVIKVMSRRFPLADIRIYPALVQGAGAAKSICDAIEYFNDNNLADVLIVGRGGGSIEDLWPFNEREVAMAIYNSDIPVISAVGHETDFTIADFVADLRAPTPSAAAELAVPDSAELYAAVKSARARLLSSLSKLTQHKRFVLESLMKRSVFASPQTLFEEKWRSLDDGVTALKCAYEGRLEEFSHILSECSYKLTALNPVNILNRGYSVAYTKDKVIKKVADLGRGERFTLRLSDGTVDCMANGGAANGGKEKF